MHEQKLANKGHLVTYVSQPITDDSSPLSTRVESVKIAKICMGFGSFCSQHKSAYNYLGERRDAIF